MSDRLKSIGMHVSRDGLVIVLLWIGGMKKCLEPSLRLDGDQVTEERARNSFPVFLRYDNQHLAWGSASRRASWTRMHRESNG